MTPGLLRTEGQGSCHRVPVHFSLADGTTRQKSVKQADPFKRVFGREKGLRKGYENN